jgi:hypothetical protein
VEAGIACLPGSGRQTCEARPPRPPRSPRFSRARMARRRWSARSTSRGRRNRS